MRFVLLFVALLSSGIDAQAPAKHFLWRVEAPNTNTAYLVGSIHVLTPDAYPLPAAID
jgi:uncharacterized protein YbaP (TraB family)